MTIAPPPYPSRRWRPLAAIMLALSIFGYSVKLWHDRAPLLQREYLWTYARLSLPEMPLWKTFTVIKRGETLALPSDSGTFTREQAYLVRPAFHHWLRDTIYEGRALPEVLLIPIVVSATAFCLLLFCALAWDRSANRASRDGRLIRGPRLVSHWRWNLRTLFKRKSAFYIETR